jgi:hypothetical protein
MKKSPLLIGFLEALGIVIYCVIISGFFLAMEKYWPIPPQFLGITVMLIILVFSAAITGSIVFGYPVLLILKENKIKEGLSILGYFALFLLIMIIVSLVLISIFI